jgi:thiosulfate/3-mercaptopyruvate sulfurtransferase
MISRNDKSKVDQETLRRWLAEGPRLARSSARRLWLTTMATALAFGGSAPFCWGEPPDQTDQISIQSSDSWQTSQLVGPQELVKSLSAATGEKPLVICVGFPFLYQGGHIVGSKFAGPGRKPEGIQALKHEMEGLLQDKQIVLYCGCCPWKDCPNIRPAFRAVQEWGFKNARALYLPTNFRQDWIAKGFPIEKGTDKQ